MNEEKPFEVLIEDADGAPYQPWVQIFAEWAHEVIEGPLDFKGTEVPARLRELLLNATDAGIIMEVKAPFSPPPLGVMNAFHRTMPVPAGYLPCNGERFEDYRTELPADFVATIAERFVSDEAVTIPDLRSRDTQTGELLDDPEWLYFIWTGDTDLLPYPESAGQRCKTSGCGERDPGTGGKWWIYYGCCSREHVLDYYGDEVNGGDVDDV